MKTMINRDKVIKGLECCMDYVNEFGDCNAPVNGCPYTIDECSTAVARDALEYIRELEEAREPVKPDKQHSDGGWCTWWYACGSCHGAIDYKDKFCRYCGKAVKWDD